ncbi:hypothetical protein K438DRAFT_1777155 [Mycena galopus ATCC 62051]|nr:hypothetical protein K438DRAFT_1777155 [Mycena galopus ATCC 62051]
MSGRPPRVKETQKRIHILAGWPWDVVIRGSRSRAKWKLAALRLLGWFSQIQDFADRVRTRSNAEPGPGDGKLCGNLRRRRSDASRILPAYIDTSGVATSPFSASLLPPSRFCALITGLMRIARIGGGESQNNFPAHSPTTQHWDPQGQRNLSRWHVRFGVRTWSNAEPNALNPEREVQVQVQQFSEPNARFRCWGSFGLNLLRFRHYWYPLALYYTTTGIASLIPNQFQFKLKQRNQVELTQHDRKWLEFTCGPALAPKRTDP